MEKPSVMIKDSKGKSSKTLFFVTIAWTLVTIKFAFAGLTLWNQEWPEMTASEYGTAMITILGVWLGREWKEAHYHD